MPPHTQQAVRAVVENADVTQNVSTFSATVAKQMEDSGVKASDVVANEYATYEDFLDSQISPVDLYYLEVGLCSCFLSISNVGVQIAQDEELARQLVELGYRGTGEVIKREEFEQRKQAELARMSKKAAAT